MREEGRAGKRLEVSRAYHREVLVKSSKRERIPEQKKAAKVEMSMDMAASTQRSPTQTPGKLVHDSAGYEGIFSPSARRHGERQIANDHLLPSACSPVRQKLVTFFSGRRKFCLQRSAAAHQCHR